MTISVTITTTDSKALIHTQDPTQLETSWTTVSIDENSTQTVVVDESLRLQIVDVTVIAITPSANTANT